MTNFHLLSGFYLLAGATFTSAAYFVFSRPRFADRGYSELRRAA